jgi:hypothetical protein
MSFFTSSVKNNERMLRIVTTKKPMGARDK